MLWSEGTVIVMGRNWVMVRFWLGFDKSVKASSPPKLVVLKKECAQTVEGGHSESCLF